MTIHAFLASPLLATVRSPASALAVALLARILAPGLLPGAAFFAGWLAGAAWPIGGAVLSWPPHGLPARLALCGAALVMIPWTERHVPRRLAPALAPLLGAAGAWWLDGATFMVTITTVAMAASGAALATLVVRLMRAADPWTRLAACATLAPALWLLGAPALLATLALVPAGAALGTIGAGTSSMALALGLSASQFASALALSHVAEGHVDAFGLACLSPLVTLWLGPRAARVAPMLAGLAAAIVALALAASLAWMRRHGG